MAIYKVMRNGKEDKCYGTFSCPDDAWSAIREDIENYFEFMTDNPEEDVDAVLKEFMVYTDAT